MPEIKAVIFDAGGVLLQGSGKHFTQRCEQELGLKAVENIRSPSGAVFGREMQLGNMKPGQELNRMFGGKLDKAKLEKALEFFSGEWQPVPEMAGLVKQLRAKYKVGLLSNTEDIHTKQFREKKKGLARLFDACVFSNEVHLVKPDERIYGLMLEKLGLKAGQCVFIDDILENVEAAERLGMKGILFETRQQCERELKKMGVEW